MGETKTPDTKIIFGSREDTLKSFVKHADEALYFVKNAGRNGLAFYGISTQGRDLYALFTDEFEQNGCGNDSFLGMIEEKFGRVREAYAYYCRAWENGSFDTCSELLLLILRTRKSDPAIDKEWPEERLVKLILDAQNVSESSRRKLENSDLYPEIAGILARAYYEGIYVPRDKAKTCEYAGKGPDNPVCIYYFGMIIIDGILSDTNPEDGINYINQAAMSGYSEALYTMGGFYADDQNWTKALDFYMRAYSAGCKKAAAQIATMYEEGYVGTVLGMPNKRKAMSWRQKSQ